MPKDLSTDGVERFAERIRPLDGVAMKRARLRLDSLTKPQGSLGFLEEELVRAAGMQGEPIPRFDRAHVVVMAADHGVSDEGVSAYPSEVTAQMVLNFLAEGAGVNALARHAGARVHVVDVGVRGDLDHPLLLQRKVRRGTRNIVREEAMTADEVREALAVGLAIGQSVAQGGGRTVILGEMGIGNTTASAAILAALTGRPAGDVTGRGTGIDEVRLRRKTEVVEAALALHRPDAGQPLEVLRKLGGLEIAGLVGVAIAAAAERAVVILDGLISTVAGMVAAAAVPAAAQYFVAGHCSAEPGHRLALEWLGLRPLLQLDMRLGEGSGGALALSVLRAAERAMREMATFGEASVSERDGSERDGSEADGGSPAPPREDVPRERGPSPSEGFPAEDEEPGDRYQESGVYFDDSERRALYKAIYLRRDIRRFLPDPVPDEVLSRILSAGHHAPSVGFMQPWNFILVQSGETKQALRDVVEIERRAAGLHFQGPRGDLYQRLKVEGILEAPLTVCVTSDPTRGGTHVLGRNSIPETDLFSVSCAIENMWLAARVENVALGWVSIFKKGDVREILRIPPHVEPVGLLSLGYTDDWPTRPLLQTSGWRDRVPLQEVVFRGYWGERR